MNLRSLRSRLETVVAVNARLWTWEVSIPFDSEPSACRLLELYRRDFPVASLKGVPLFVKMVAFNSDSGRKIRYLVVLAEKSVRGLTRNYDRALPDLIKLYGIADKVIRSASPKICECVSEAKNVESAGNAVFSFLQNGRLFILVFWSGRLCHWSEEVGYEDGFGGTAYESRMERFRKFIELDDYFSQGSVKSDYSEYRKNLDLCAEVKLANRYFRRAARDPFWWRVDLDQAKRVRPLVQKGVVLFVLMALALLLIFGKIQNVLDGVPAEVDSVKVLENIALSPPPAFPKSWERRDSLYKDSAFRRPGWRTGGVDVSQESLAKKGLDSPTVPVIKLRSIVEGVVFQGFVDGTLKWFRLGDSLGLYVVKSIGRDRVVLESGVHLVEVLHE